LSEPASRVNPEGVPLANATTAEPTRRDFLYIATGAAGAVGAALTAWPFIDQMNPTSSVLAMASIEVDLAAIQPGQAVVLTFRSHPLFVRRRTPKEIAEARSVSIADLPDKLARNENLPEDAPATDENREAKSEWYISSGVCTHLGCTPTAFEGDYGGWLCHCHGSQYDTAGRIRKGPAPQNLAIPKYAFLSPTRVKVG
jgi:ubiquinol-cytochrome c reductase iron-sulfur subunit